jgi:hypothetical protein
VGGWRSSPPALRALARGGALRLLRCCCFEQRLQQLAHSSLLGSCRLRAAAQQHGRSDKVLGRPPEERRCVSVGVRASIGASIVIGLWHACGWRRCAAARLVCSRTMFAPGVDRLSPHGLGPGQARPVQVVARMARRPCQALGVEGPAPRQVGALSQRVRRAAHAAGRRRLRWRGAGSDSELLNAVAT